MSTATDIKVVINKVISDYGSTITLNTTASTSFDKWGDKTVGSITTSTFIAVPISFFHSRIMAKLGGEHKESDLAMIMSADTSLIITNDNPQYITWQGADYNVLEIKEIYLQDTLLAKRLELKKRQ